MKTVQFGLSVILALVGYMADPVYAQNADNQAAMNNNNTCHLHAMEGQELNTKMLGLKEDGAKLVEMHLHFPFYDENPLLNNTKHYYKPNIWRRIFAKHGETLLSLPFDYGPLSMTFLTFGVEKHFAVRLTDVPERCFGKLSPQDKISAVQQLLTTDFLPHSDDVKWDAGDKVCHTVIVNRDGIAYFENQCCEWSPHKVNCEIIEQNMWISLLYSLINAMDVIFFLFGPLIAQQLFAHKSYRVTQYIVKLAEPHFCFIRKHVQAEDEEEIESIEFSKEKSNCLESSAVEKRLLRRKQEKEVVAFKSKYVECFAKLPPDERTRVKMSALYIQVDHRNLMTEKEVSVGIFSYLWRNVVLCKMARYHPFKSCCSVPVCGTWGGKLCYAKIPNENFLSRFCIHLGDRYGRQLQWKNFFRVTGLVFAIVFFIPLPFYIRRYLYWQFQKEEYEKMEQDAHTLGLMLDSRTIFHVSEATLEIIYWVSLGLYFFSTLILLGIYRRDKVRFTQHIINLLQDLKHIKRLECIRLFLLHLVTPFEKFGLLAFIAAFLYWIPVFPIVFVVVVFYTFPTIYLIGRFCCSGDFFSGLIERNKVSISYLQEMFMLRYISPSPELLMPVKPLKMHGKWDARLRKEYPCLAHFLIGLLLSTGMISLLILYAECFRYVVEILMLTLMGAMVNAGSAGQYFFVAFFLITYAMQVLNNFEEKYLKLSSKIFGYIKEKLDSNVTEIIRMRGDEQKNVAFKFFSEGEIGEIYRKRDRSEISDYFAVREPSTVGDFRDRFAFVKDILHWRLHSLIFFIDRQDMPRIPRELFDEISALNLPGTPGPVYMNILMALRQLSYMLLFFLLIMLVVLAFGDAYSISTTNQLLLTLVGGFVPFILIRVIKPKTVELNMNTYSFQGKIHEIIKNYEETWPIYDLDFEVAEDKENVGDDGETAPGIAGIIDPDANNGTDEIRFTHHNDGPEEHAHHNEASEVPTHPISAPVEGTADNNAPVIPPKASIEEVELETRDERNRSVQPLLERHSSSSRAMQNGDNIIEMEPMNEGKITQKERIRNVGLAHDDQDLEVTIKLAPTAEDKENDDCIIS